MPLETTAVLRVDLLDPGAPQIIHAVQDDSDSRKIAFNIYAGGAQWAVPDGTLVTVRYKKPDGTAGFYDTLPDGSTPAATIDDNVVTVALVPQAFTVRGNVPVQIKLYNSAGASIATFAIVMHVSANVVSDAEIVSSDYYSVLTKQIADVLAAAEGIPGQVSAAQAAAEQAASSASAAAGSATAAAGSADTATTAAGQAQTAATNASQSETNAASSASDAEDAKTAAETAAGNASDDATAAANAKTAAETAATNSQSSAESAAESASQAADTLANALPKSGGEISGTLKIVGGIKPVELGSFTDMDNAGWTAIQDWYNGLPVATSALALIVNNQGDSHGLSGGFTFLSASKTGNPYGVIEATTYFPPYKRYCVISDGVFSDFSASTTATASYIPTQAQSAAVVSRMMLAQMPDLTVDDKLRVSGLYDTWAAGSHAEGDICNAEDQAWECFQAHDNATYPDIKPGSAAWYTFWRPLHGKSPETARPFVPVQGAHDMYHAGEYAVYNGALYRCVQDTAYSPEDFPGAWENAERTEEN